MLLYILIVLLFISSSIYSQEEKNINCTNNNQYIHPVTKECLNFTSAHEKASNDYSTTINEGNTAWILVSTGLVMIMTPGVAFFYAGLAGEKMASNTMMMSFVSMAVISIQFMCFGYSIAFGDGNGLFNWAGYKKVSGISSGIYGKNIPSILFAAYQTQFAMITPALLSGGIVGRMKFGTFIIFIIFWTTFVYDPLAHWMWSFRLNSITYEVEPLGWLVRLGALDFAGGTVIHVSSGFGALVAAIVVGKRYDHGEPVKPHNIPLVMIGCTLLWFGWFGFNGGSALAANGIAAIAIINTQLSACAGFLTWIIVEYLFEKKMDPCGAASGAVAGLVAITPGCGYVYPYASLIFGIIGTCTSYMCIRIKNWLRYDDTLDSFAIHGCAGFVGGILTAFFATKEVNDTIVGGIFYEGNLDQLWYQLIAQLVAAIYSTVLTFTILMLLKYTIGLRVSKYNEIDGIDRSIHGGTAYYKETITPSNKIHVINNEIVTVEQDMDIQTEVASM